MTKYLELLEEMFLKMDSSSQPMHASSIEILRLPKNAGADYIPKLVQEFRAITPIDPFNKTVRGTGWHHWKTVDVDMSYHVRHVSLPGPGSMQQLMDFAADLYGPMLNRSLPLWECWVIDGLEGNRFAILVKGHHALTDGMNGMNAHLRSFSATSDDTKIRAPWGDNGDSSIHRGVRDAGSASAKPISNTQKPSSSAVTSLLSTAKALWPAKTKSSRLNGTPKDSVRRFGGIKLPLDDMKAVSSALGASINDLLVALIDHAVNQYLKMTGDHPVEPLAVVMPISTRREGESGGASNQVVTVSAQLGAPTAPIAERVMQIRDSLKASIKAISQLPGGAQAGYTIFLSALMPQISIRANSYFPSRSVMGSSMSVSNITPPRGAHYVKNPLYRAGSLLEAYYIQPILNGGILLNVTAMCYDAMLNVGIGSVPGAVDDPMMLGQFMRDALDELVSDTSVEVNKKSVAKNIKPVAPRTRSIPKKDPVPSPKKKVRSKVES